MVTGRRRRLDVPAKETQDPAFRLEGQQQDQPDRRHTRDHGEAQDGQNDEPDQSQDRLDPDAGRQARQKFEELLAVHVAQRFSKSQTSGNPIRPWMSSYCGSESPTLVPLSLRCANDRLIASAATLRPSTG